MTTRRFYSRLPVLALLSVGLAAPVAAQFPTEPPPPATMRPLQLPPFQRFRMANGLEVVVVANHELPLVSIGLTMQAGDRYDPPGKEGLASIVADALLKGTASRDADEIALTIESVGASLNASAGADFFTVSTTVLKDNLPLAMDLISDVLLHPTFPPDEVELTRTRQQSGLKAQEAQPAFLAARFFNAGLYGDHPYGRTATSTTLGAITRDDVVQFQERQLRPGGAVLVLAGDLTEGEAREIAEQYLGEWSGSPTPPAEAPLPTPQPTSILLVNRPGSAQSNIRVGNLALEPGDPDYYAAVVANQILGAGADSRLFLILREDKGWTYGAYSNLNRPRGVGRFQASTEVRTEVTDSSLTELLHQIDRMRRETVADSELTAAEGFLLGSFPLRVETPQQIAGQVRTVELLRLGDDYLQQYRERLAAVNADAVEQVARRLMKPDSAVIVVVGDGPAIYDGLARIAPVDIVDADGNPLSPADLTPTAAALTFDPSRIVAGTDSFTIFVQGQVFGSMTRSLEQTSVNGHEVLRASTAINLPPFLQQSDVLTVDAASLRAMSYEMSGKNQGIETSVQVTYRDNHVTGSASVPNPQTRTAEPREIDQDLDPNVIDGNLIQVFAGALPLADGAKWPVAVFSPNQGGTIQVTLSVSDGGEMTVPAGTFDTWKLDVQGGPAPLELWIAKGPERRLVKLVAAGQLDMQLSSFQP